LLLALGSEVIWLPVTEAAVVCGDGFWWWRIGQPRYATHGGTTGGPVHFGCPQIDSDQFDN